MLQGNALVKLGIITPNDLIWLTMNKVEEILYSLFGWRKGKIRCFETGLDGFDIIHLKLSPGRIIMEGSWRYFEEEEIMKVFGSWDVLFDVVESPPLSRRDLDLAENEIEIMGYINGRKKISEIAAATGLQKLEVLKVIFGFYNIGLLMISGQAREDKKEEEKKLLSEMRVKLEDVQKQNYYEILNLDRDVNEREIKKVFFRFTKKYHPDRSFRFADQEILDLMLKIFLAGKDAYEILSHTESRREYDNFLLQKGEAATAEDFQEYIKPNIELSKIMKAEDLFNKAKGLLFSGRAGDALEFFEKSLELVPDDPDYNAYTGLSLARMKRDYQQAIQHIEKALEVNPQNADYHAYLGETHQRFGKKGKAIEAYSEALEINPRHIHARREYNRMQSKSKK
jgi:tetratricopeptide (TPR) repeat protein